MSEILSLVPGSLIQFHTVELNLSRLKKQLGELSFWAREDTTDPDAPQDPRIILVPLNRSVERGQECWEYFELNRNAPGQYERNILTFQEAQKRKIITVSYKDLIEVCEGQWLPLPWLAFKEDGNNIAFFNNPSNWVRGCLRIDQDNGNCTLDLAFDTNIALLPPPSVRQKIAEDLEKGLYAPLSPDDQSSAIQQLMPTHDNVESETVFGLPSDPQAIRNWIAVPGNEWVIEWTAELIDAAHERVNLSKAKQQPTPEEKEKRKYLPAALWQVLVQLISNNRDTLKDGASSLVGLVPKVQFIKLDKAPPIEVDLVLDLGNFRSCGVLIEQKPDRSENRSNNGLENCRLLELRDLTQPSCSYKGIFPSRIEFARATFGLDHWSRESGHATAFFWPGQVRVGQQAERLLTSKTGTEGRSGLATPKRYLWSRDSWINGWYFNTAENNAAGSAEQPVAGRFRIPLHDLLTSQTAWIDAGWQPDDLPSPLDYSASELGFQPDQYEEKASRANRSCILSRSQLFILMVEELVLQAIRFMNDPVHRAECGFEGTARHLRSVVFTMPPGMALAERRIFQQRVKAGVCFAWEQARQDKIWGWSEVKETDTAFVPSPLGNPPQVECDLDEATATQLVWLENEIVTRMGGNVREFFALYGHRRAVTERVFSRQQKKDITQEVEKETVRIASLDIGGGTTDMMVATYARDESGDALTPTQNFRESFQLAGDNLLEKVTTDIVLKQSLASALEQEGVPDPLTLLRKLFKTSCPDVRDEAVRHLLVSILLEPAALKVLEIYESVPRYKTGILSEFTLGSSEKTPPSGIKETQWQRCTNLLRKFLKEHCGHNTALLSKAMQRFLKQGDPNSAYDDYSDDEEGTEDLKPFDFKSIVVTVNVDAVESCIQSTLGQTLKLFSAAIREYQCDVMLLSGRPSKLRHVTDIITSQLPVMPQRIVCMHNYTVSLTYPFSNAYGKIDDPKTTVVCGAAIWKLAAQKRLLNFTLRTEELKMKSTVNFIGVMEANAGTISKALNSEPLDLEKPGSKTKDNLATDIVAPQDAGILDQQVDDGGQIIQVPGFNNEIHLGWRQLPTPSWTATPLYRIGFRPDQTNTLSNLGYRPPYSLFLQQARTAMPENLDGCKPTEALRRIRNATLRHEDLVLCGLRSEASGSTDIIDAVKLNKILEIQLMTTLEPQGHWRDTGSLTLNW